MNRVRNLLLLVALLVCAGSWWWARRQAPDQATTSTSGPEPPSVAARAVPGDPLPRSVHVAVLNGTGESGLARRFSRRLPDLGCVVVTTADAPHDTFSHSLVVNRRLSGELAEALAARLGVGRIVNEWDARCREDAVIVLGHDHGQLLGGAADH